MAELLSADGLVAGWGAARVLEGVSFSIEEGQSIALLGRNGMGKTTTLKTIMGLNKPTTGRISFDGVDITGAAPERISRLGIGYVPEERGIFSSLTVEEEAGMEGSGLVNVYARRVVSNP